MEIGRGGRRLQVLLQLRFSSEIAKQSQRQVAETTHTQRNSNHTQVARDGTSNFEQKAKKTNENEAESQSTRRARGCERDGNAAAVAADEANGLLSRELPVLLALDTRD